MIDGIFVLGLTGSIGMGKSTTAGFFQKAGLPVWDADAAVHRLYAPGGAAVAGIKALCPEAVGEGGVDRAALRAWIARDSAALTALNALVHPLVAADRAEFIAQSAAGGHRIVVVDVPLLYETGGDAHVDVAAEVRVPEVDGRQLFPLPARRSGGGGETLQPAAGRCRFTIFFRHNPAPIGRHVCNAII